MIQTVLLHTGFVLFLRALLVDTTELVGGVLAVIGDVRLFVTEAEPVDGRV